MAPGPILTWPAQAFAPLCIPYSRVLLLKNDAPLLSTMLYFIALALFLCSSWITAVIHVFVYLFFWLQVAFLASWSDFMPMPPPCFPALGVNTFCCHTFTLLIWFICNFFIYAN